MDRPVHRAVRQDPQARRDPLVSQDPLDLYLQSLVLPVTPEPLDPQVIRVQLGLHLQLLALPDPQAQPDHLADPRDPRERRDQGVPDPRVPRVHFRPSQAHPDQRDLLVRRDPRGRLQQSLDPQGQPVRPVDPRGQLAPLV